MANQTKPKLQFWVGWVIAIITLGLYLSTLAQGLILGDPTEYTIVSHMLGIAHPPGYAFMTIVGKLAQTVIPFDTIAWRSHVVNAVVGTLIVTAIYNIFLILLSPSAERMKIGIASFTALAVAVSPNHWQHSIHANPHLLTATFLIVNCWLLLRWWHGREEEFNRPLVLFAFLTGLGAVHHPLTVFSFPAYTLFILVVYPRILTDWRLLLNMIVAAAVGLSLFAYYPIISNTQPIMGPHTMNTLQGFLDHVLARGLSDALPYYSLAEQPIRAIVFGSIIRLQFGWLGGVFAILGGIGLIRTKRLRHPAVLLLVGLAVNYGFVISLKQQDIMAYIMGPNLLTAVLMGVGLWVMISWFARIDVKWADWGVLTLAFLLIPVWTLGVTLPHVSLRNFAEGTDHVEATFSSFAGKGEGVVLLNNWEFMTPLWYAKYVDNHWPDPADVRPKFVSVADPWLPSVFNNLPGGPVYLNGYKREIVDAGFRLRPRGPFYQVVEPGDSSIPVELIQPTAPQKSGWPQLVGYELEKSPVEGGDYVRLVLAMQLDEPTADFFVPAITLANDNTQLYLPYTTDSHLTTPLWQPEEVIVERYDFALPHAFPAGDYTVDFEFINLSDNGSADNRQSLGTLQVAENTGLRTEIDDLLANFRQRVGLTRLTARSGLQRREAPWSNPMEVAAGDVVIVKPRWEALDSAEESYTIFVHLIDASNQSYANLDYTPLGGAVPTHLWFPKWLPGQSMTDPYRLVVPESLSPGTYHIEVGMYEMISQRRLAMHDEDGNQVGDRYIAGSIEVR